MPPPALVSPTNRRKATSACRPIAAYSPLSDRERPIVSFCATDASGGGLGDPVANHVIIRAGAAANRVECVVDDGYWLQMQALFGDIEFYAADTIPQSINFAPADKDRLQIQVWVKHDQIRAQVKGNLPAIAEAEYRGWIERRSL